MTVRIFARPALLALALLVSGSGITSGQTLIRVGQTVITAKLEAHGANSRCHFFLTVMPAA